MTSQPNVLLLMADEHPWFMTGCYGHPGARTPTLDRLAERGVIFDAAYCASPLCAPSRAAMMTGRLASTLQTWDNASPLGSDWPTFAHSFRAAGYRTALSGKMHFVGPDQLHGFEERWTQDIYPATFDWTPSTREKITPGSGQHVRRVHEAGVGRSRDMDYDDEVLFRAQNGLRHLAREGGGRPWMLCVSFTGPHYPFKCPEPYWSSCSDEDINLPELPADYLERDPQYVKWLRHYGGFETPVPDEVCRAARRAVLGRINMVDDYFGRILALLEELGMLDEALVCYTSDHGDMMGERGLWFKGFAYEPSARVPLIFAGPGVPAGRRISEVTSHLDLGETLCSLAGVEPVYEVTDGRDLAGLVRGERPPGEGQAIMEYYAEGVRRGWRAVRRGDHKLVSVPGCEPELFNVKQDPGEWQNLAGEPDCAAVRADLEARLGAGADPERLDEERHQSEERRLAILRALGEGQPREWQMPSGSPPHPLGFR